MSVEHETIRRGRTIFGCNRRCFELMSLPVKMAHIDVVFPRCWAWAVSIGSLPIHISRGPIEVPHRVVTWSLGNIYVYGQSSTLELAFGCELGPSLIWYQS
ncbi:hypothetical protein YC2023_069844 [Brassica napus]